MKLYIAAAVLCFTAVNLFAKPNNSTANDENNGAEYTKFSLALNDCEKPTADTETANASPIDWHTALKKSDWWLVIIAGLTALAIVYQAKEMASATAEMKKQADIMRRSTEATERSVRLQEIAQQQWVQMTDWRTEQRSPAQGNPSSFTVAMEITNPTSIPLTVKAVTAIVAGRKFSFVANNMIGPSDNVKVEFPIVLTDAEKTLCATYKLIFAIDGCVTFVEGIGTDKRREQPFCMSCNCGPNDFAEFSSIQDTRNQQAGDQKAN
jgi:hypothetical protein